MKYFVFQFSIDGKAYDDPYVEKGESAEHAFSRVQDILSDEIIAALKGEGGRWASFTVEELD